MDSGYSPVEQGKRRGYTKARLKGFCEEELGGSIGMFKEVPDHVFKIARIVRQPQGHLLILGASRAGNTPLSWSDCEDGKICCILNEPNGMDSGYSSVEQSKRRGYTKARLNGFCKEELDGLIGMFKEVPDHVLMIARIVRRPQGHLLILGASGDGKTPLSWSDCEDGKIRFVLNESNVMGSGFRERMNSLLANAEGKEGTPRRWRS